MKPNTVHLDFESQSAANIGSVGAYLYVHHETTRPICLSWKTYDFTGFMGYEDFGEDSEYIHWMGGIRLYYLAKNPDVIFVAHNTPFEYYMWHRFMVPLGFPPIPWERWKCTMAKAYAHGLPGGLEMAAFALGLENQKLVAEKDKVKYLWSPKTSDPVTFWLPSEKFDDYQTMYRYCDGDVLAEEELDDSLRDLSPTEQEVWVLDQEINERGVRTDIELVDKIQTFIAIQKEIDTQAFFETQETGVYFEIHDKVIRPSQRAKFKQWLAMEGFKLPNLKKPTMDRFMLRQDLPDHIRQACIIYRSAGKTSLAKYATMQRQRDLKGIIREISQYHKAHTGRFGHKGVQYGNQARPTVDVNTVCGFIEVFGFGAFAEAYPDVTEALSSATRGMVIPREDGRLLVGDFKQMEARVLCYLAGQPGKLKRYAEGEDMYCIAATPIFGREITPDDKFERQVGKVSELGLGFGGGIGAYVTMSEGYKVDLSIIYNLLWHTANAREMEKAETGYILYIQRHKANKKKDKGDPVIQEIGLVCDLVKQRWRFQNPEVVQYWGELEHGAIQAVQSAARNAEVGKPGESVKVGDVTFYCHRQFLFCRLPSGRDIAYPYPRVHEGERGGLRLEYMEDDKDRGGWVRTSTYGGKLSENIVQGFQRDLLTDAMLRLKKAKYKIVLHVHDEIVCDQSNGSKDEMEAIMAEQSKWAPALPIGVDAWEGMRYDKH